MKRRTVLKGGVAALAGRDASVRAAASVVPGAQHDVLAPKRYLRGVIDEAFLRRHLAPPGAWHPYPKAAERAAWQGVPADAAAAVIGRADAWLDAEWPTLPASLFLEFKENGNRTRYEARYFARRQRLAGLVLAECLQGQGRYLHAIADGVWHVCEESFWGLPAHSGMQRSGVGLGDVQDPIIDLFAAETGVSLAYVHYLLGPELAAVSPLLPARIAYEVKRRILDPAWSHDDFKWMGLKDRKEPLNNWTSWICSSWLEANLLLEPDPERRVAAALKICGCLDGFLRDYADDGACEEGPGYWEMSAGPYLDCLLALGSATGGAVDLAADPFVRRMGHYVFDAHIAGDWFVNYGDAHAKVHHSPQLLYRFGRATGDGAMMAFGAQRAPARGIALSSQGRLARDLPDLLQTGALRTHARADALGGTSWYPALGLMTARARPGTADGFYLAVQTASNARSHGHHDSGSFIVFHDGMPVFVDPGVEAYTAKTFSAQRYTIWTMQSGYHNLPACTAMSMELATTFGPEAGVDSWRRSIALERGGAVEARGAGTVGLRETFRLARPATVALVFMTPRLPAAAQPGVLVLAPPGAGMPVHLCFDAQALRAEVEPVVLTDPGLRREWGETLYRIRLVSPAAMSEGDLRILIT
jgi:hypothetical protein